MGDRILQYDAVLVLTGGLLLGAAIVSWTVAIPFRTTGTVASVLSGVIILIGTIRDPGALD